jgi:vacuolar-type H+-ATPase subunit F/Vma7
VARILYLGDEATAAGYRLAGADTRTPAAEEELEAFRRALDDDADLVLLSATLAAALPGAEVASAVLAADPLVAVVPDVHGQHPPVDLAREVRLALGIEP